MASFVDAAGRTHELTITFGQAVGALKAAGLDLACEDYNALARVVYGDVFALVRCVKVLAPAAEFEGAGVEVLDAAAQALEDAIADFSLRPPLRARVAGPDGGLSNPSGGPPGRSA